VSAILHDMETTGNAGTSVPLGNVALVTAGTVDVVLVTLRTQAFNIDLFTKLGCDVRRKKLVVVKSAQHFYASYAEIASQVIYVSAPGSASPDWKTLPYRRIMHPKWPIS